MTIRQHYKIQALYHNKKPQLSHDALSWVRGSVHNQSDLETLTQQAKILVHCAGKISIDNHERNEVISTNLDGTKNAIGACLVNSCKLVYISSINAVDPNPLDETLNENRSYRSKHKFAYAYSKAKAEKAVQAAIIEKGLKAIIIRPSSILGLPDLGPSILGASLIKFSKQTVVIIPKAGFDFVDVRDVSAGIINSFNKGLFIGDIYHLCGHYASFKSLIKLINPNKMTIQVPLSIMNICLPFVRVFNLFLKNKIPFTPESLRAMKLAPQKISSEKAIKQLDYKPRPLKDSMRDFDQWFES